MKSLILALLIPIASFAQKVENTRAEVVGDKIVVTYDLVQGEQGDSYTVSLFSSFNNFRSALTQVSGDVGPGVKLGQGRKINWEAKQEMGSYRGSVTFEVEAVLVAPLTLKSPISSTKRGTKVPLQWRGGDHHKNVKIELVRDGQVVSVIDNVANQGAYEWQMSSGTKAGKDYVLRLTNGSETATSPPFDIKRKIPVWVLVAVPVVIAGVLLIPKSSSDSSTKTDRLPPPPAILN